jgi:Tol biopolymer transport system component/DNA-binding winged helix-turn-helix (wHTH) protein
MTNSNSGKNELHQDDTAGGKESPFLSNEHLTYECEAFRLDLVEQTIYWNGQKRKLSAKKFELLRLLIRNAGQVVQKNEIFKTVWPDRFIDESNISQNILYLRKIIEKNPQTPVHILTIPGAGYMFLPEVQQVAKERPPAPLPSSEPEVMGQRDEVIIVPPRQPVATNITPRLLWLNATPGRRLGVMTILLMILVTCSILWTYIRPAHKREWAGLITQPLITMNGQKGALAFSPDGRSLAFTSIERNSGQYGIFVKRSHEERMTELTNNASHSSRVAWSPDSQQIAFLREIVPGEQMQQVFIIPAAGGKEELIGEAVGGLDWSPHGKSLAITDRAAPYGPLLVYLLSVDEKTRSPLTILPGGSSSFDHDPRFSPDGRSIAFIRQHSPFNCDILLIELASGRLIEVASNQSEVRSLQWSTDSQELLYLSKQSGTSQIWSLPIQNLLPQAVTTVCAGSDNFAISPVNGQMVLSCLDTIQKISIVELGDGATHPLCEIRSTEKNFYPQFSNDGRQIAFVSDRTGFEEIWIMDTGCSYQTNLTNLRQRGLGRPRWSPDGKRIAFHRYNGNQTDIFLVEVIGGQIQQLTDHPRSDLNPTWSADGRWIYFSSVREQDSSNKLAGEHIWRVSTDGGPALPVTVNNGLDSWESADGKRLLFSYESRLYEKIFATGEERQFDDLIGMRIDHNWIPVSGGIYVFNQVDGESCVNFFDLDSHQIRRITCLNKQYNRPIFQRSLRGLSSSPGQKLLALSLEYTQGGEISIMHN